MNVMFNTYAPSTAEDEAIEVAEWTLEHEGAYSRDDDEYYDTQALPVDDERNDNMW